MVKTTENIQPASVPKWHGNGNLYLLWVLFLTGIPVFARTNVTSITVVAVE